MSLGFGFSLPAYLTWAAGSFAGGGGIVPVIPDRLLKEDGDALLLESGDYILLE